MQDYRYSPKVNVLLVAASRHGATTGIAEVISDTLRREGITVHMFDPDDLVHVQDFDVVILGSAIYDKTWLPEMTDFIIDYRVELLHMPVYLFSSGPVGMQGSNGGVIVEDIVRLTHAREHKVFHGALHKHTMRPMERLRARLAHVPEGDERDWGNIIAWARHLAHEFRQLAVASPTNHS